MGAYWIILGKEVVAEFRAKGIQYAWTEFERLGFSSERGYKMMTEAHPVLTKAVVESIKEANRALPPQVSETRKSSQGSFIVDFGEVDDSWLE
jgi:hypothetical protein